MRRGFHIVMNGEGVGLFDDNDVAVWKIRWEEVKEVVAYKDDVFAYDIICVGFRVGDEPYYQCCDEEHKGWDELHRELAERFGVRLEDWWQGVAFPAFARNWTILWGKPACCRQCGYDLRAHKAGERCPECGAAMPGDLVRGAMR